MCIGASGLVGVADVAAAVLGHEIEGAGLLEGVVELLAEGIAASHELDEFRQVERQRPGGLPGVGLNPAGTAQRIEVLPASVTLLGEDQPLLRIEERRPAVGAALEHPGVGLLAQTGRHAAQGPVLIGPLDRLARTLGAPAVAHVELQVLGALVAHHAARHVVTAEHLVGMLRVDLLHEPLHVGAYDHVRRRAAGHDERVASGTGAARQQPAIVGILHQAGREIVQNLGPGKAPQHIQVPLREPQRIESVHVELRPSLRIERQPAQLHRVGRTLVDIVSARIVGIPAVHVVDLVTAQQHVPQVGVELDPLRLGAALDGHAAQHLVPDGARLGVHGVEIPAVELRAQVGLGILHARVRHADLEEHLAGLLQVEVEHQARLVTGDHLRIGQHTLLVPAVDRREGTVALQHEAELDAVGTAPEAVRRRELADNRAVILAQEHGPVHRAAAQPAAGIDDQLAPLALGVVHAIEGHAVGRRILDPCMVAVEVEAVVARLDDFASVVEVRLPARHALRGIDLTGRRHDVESGNHPVIHLREAQNLGEVVVVSAAALILVAREGVGGHHAEGTRRGRAVEPAAARGLDPGIDPLDILGVVIARREYLDLRETDVLAGAVGRLEAQPLHLAGCEAHAARRAVVGNRRDADRRAVAEAERTAREVLVKRRAVVEHDALDRNLLVPLQLRPRHVHHAPRGDGALAGPLAAAVVADQAVVQAGRAAPIRERIGDGSMCQRGDIVLCGLRGKSRERKGRSKYGFQDCFHRVRLFKHQ